MCATFSFLVPLTIDNRSTLTDRDLINRIHKGDMSSKMELYRRYHAPVFQVACRILQDRVIAEDVMQDTMIIAFDKLDSLQEVEKLRSWLCTIARNESLRELKRRRKVSFDDESYPEIDASEDKVFAEHWTVEEIMKEIDALPDGYRVILNLYLLDNLSHEEISETLNISAGTSRSQYLRAKARLRQQMLRSDERRTEKSI